MRAPRQRSGVTVGIVGDLPSLIDSAREADRAGDWDRALEYYEAAFARVGREGDAADAAKLLRWIGHVHRQRGQLELAEEVYQASLAVAEASELEAEVAGALNVLAIVAQHRGQLGVAEHFYGRARALADALGDDRLAAMVEQNLGSLANIRGDIPDALIRYRAALRRFERLDDRLAAAWAYNNIGMAHVDRKEWGLAETCYAEAFRLAELERDTGTLGSVELNRAELHIRRGAYAEARESCDRAFEIFARLESDSGVAEAYKLYGALYRETAKPNLACDHLDKAILLARDCGDPLLEAEACSELALLHLGQGDNKDALRRLTAAHRLFTKLDARREIHDLERRLDRLEQVFLRVVRRWAESIESKDRYTAGHCERVADYACMLAESLGIRGRDLAWFRMGALLHDVGKTSIPSELLNKPGKLTPEEFERVKRHTTVGDEIIADLDFPWEIRPMVRNHHERWDGGGYPDGLKGEEIPLTARILCVADVFDALTTERSYRPALPREEALRIMESDAGRLLDPVLFGEFRRLVSEGATRPRAIANA